MRRQKKQRIIAFLIVGTLAALIIVTLILGAESNRRADETIARVDRILAEYEI